MEISIDKKIQMAIEPLLVRIAALQADNLKFKQEIIALQNDPHHKPVQKQINKYGQEIAERPQTVKAHRIKSVDQHDLKGEIKADKKNISKKQEIKVEQDISKADKVKNNIIKVPISGPVPNPTNIPKQVVNKDVKPKPTPTTGVKRNSSEVINNKSSLHEKKAPGTKVSDDSEGQVKHEEKKEHKSHEKNDHKGEHKAPSTHLLKSPVQNKPKPGDKPPNDKKPVTGVAAKKGGKEVKAEAKEQSGQAVVKQEQKVQVHNEEVVQSPKIQGDQQNLIN